MFRAIIQNWLRGAAQQKLREKAEEFAREQLRRAQGHDAAEGEEGARPRLCDVGIVFALETESGGLEDLMEDAVSFRGQGFLARWGRLRGRHVAVVRSGAGRASAAGAAEALIDGHRPAWVVSAGFAGGLAPEMKRHDLLLADAVVDAAGNRLGVDPRAAPEPLKETPGVHVGTLVTVDEVARTPDEKQALREKHQALAVDMETFAVAEVCARRGVPLLAVRVICDPADEELAPEVRGLLKQKSGAARLGAALGAVWNRPSSLKDMYRLRENALVASDRLAEFLAAAVEVLVPEARRE